MDFKYNQTMNLKPFIKWSGGKQNIKNKIISYFPTFNNKTLYVEPFLGGGTILFHLKPKNAIISDTNKNLINTYIQIKTNLKMVIKILTKFDSEYKDKNTDQKKYFYTKRKEYNEIKHKNNQEIKNKPLCASLFIFLNKTCFNGLYRENLKGDFNTPKGSYKNPTILDIKLLQSISEYLNSNNIEIYSLNYTQIFEKLETQTQKKNIIIYLDPPYYPTDTSKFISYGQNVFDKTNHEQLK